MAPLLAGAGAWLWPAPPELVRVGVGYGAKIVCSSVFIGGRGAHRAQQQDVQALLCTLPRRPL